MQQYILFIQYDLIDQNAQKTVQKRDFISIFDFDVAIMQLFQYIEKFCGILVSAHINIHLKKNQNYLVIISSYSFKFYC
jgi:hypothetical protein